MLSFVANCQCCGEEVWGMSPSVGGVLCLTCEWVARRAAEEDEALAHRDPPGVNGPGWCAPND
jgi:hypothetical protein